MFFISPKSFFFLFVRGGGFLFSFSVRGGGFALWRTQVRVRQCAKQRWLSIQ